MAEPMETDYTIAGCYAGYPITIEVRGNLAALPRVVERLRGLGIEPPSASQRPAQRPQQGAEAVRYDDDGHPWCTAHNRKMKESDKRAGTFYCTAKDGDDFCKVRA